MAVVTAHVMRQQGCPFYSIGDSLELRDRLAVGINDVLICWRAVAHLSRMMHRLLEQSGTSHHIPNVPCGGCDKGKAHFLLQSLPSGEETHGGSEIPLSVLRTLLKMNIFSTLSHERLRQILPFFNLRAVSTGDTLVKAETLGSELFIVTVGQFLVLVEDGKGQEIRLSSLGIGECFGMTSLLTNHPAPATIRAATPGRVLVISRKDFDKIISWAPSIGLALSRILVSRLTDMFKRTSEEMRQGMIGRLDHLAPADLIETVHAKGMSGALCVSNGGHEMNIHFDRGEVRRVEFQDQEDEEAFYRFLSWQKGKFAFNTASKMNKRTRRVSRDTKGLLFEGLRRLDEESKPPPPSQDPEGT